MAMSVDLRTDETQGGYSSAHDLRCENLRLRELLSMAERKAARCSIMLHEADHRIKNSLQIVASLISLQAGRAKDTPSGDALRAAAIRVHAVARMHDALQASGGDGRIHLGAVFEKMGAALRDMYGETGPVTVQILAEPVLVPVTLAQPIALAVNELAINAMRHGYPHGRSGVIRISLLRTDHALRVIVADDGVGLPKDYVGGAGYGMKLVRMITKQIGATLHVDRISGARFSLIVPGAYALASRIVGAAA
jgi:two-component system, sensor histidine kinase PdtaS